MKRLLVDFHSEAAEQAGVRQRVRQRRVNEGQRLQGAEHIGGDAATATVVANVGEAVEERKGEEDNYSVGKRCKQCVAQSPAAAAAHVHGIAQRFRDRRVRLVRLQREALGTVQRTKTLGE